MPTSQAALMTDTAIEFAEQAASTADEALPATCEPPVSPGAADAGARELVIQPTSGWKAVDFRELLAYRDLFLFLTWRSIKVQYAQSALGVGWAVIQPLFQMLVFTVVFGYLAKVESDGEPYSLFSLAALLPWTYFSGAVTTGTQSLVANTKMLTKVYFPRLVMPLSAVAAKLVDFVVAFIMTLVLMACFGQTPSWNVLWLPVLIVLMMLTAAGLSTWLTALAIQYRDVKYGLNFVIQLLMYAAPVIYSTYQLPRRYDLGELTPALDGWIVAPRLIYALNPMVGVIEGFRSALLGSRPMPWDFLAIGTVTATLVAGSGLYYFRSRERLFADVA